MFHHIQKFEILAIPLAPGAPSVKDWSERHMALQWKEPIDDGGLPITGYHVEAKANNGEDWQLCEVIDTPVTRATVQGIQQGIEYQFRVIAISKAGKSEPSLPSRAKEARAQRRKLWVQSYNHFYHCVQLALSSKKVLQSMLTLELGILVLEKVYLGPWTLA